MFIAKVVATSLSLAYLASCSDPVVRSDQADLAKRDILVPVNPYNEADIYKRQDSSAGPNGERIVQIVTVSDNNGSLKYFPENIKAEIGSVVQFQFYPKNHTITESSFADPCKPIAANLTSVTRPGQKSGFVPVTADTQFRPIYNLIVNDTKPMWIYCGQTPHCEKGMAMVINQNDSSPNTLEAYKAKAAQIQLPNASSSAAASSTSASGTTVTPPATTNNPAGPSLAGATTTTGTSSGSISQFTPGPNLAGRDVPAFGIVVAAGAALALL